MQTYHLFDTHAFVKAFVNAKTDEEKGEILARTIAITEEKATNAIALSEAKSANVVEKKFDNAKDELATKVDVKDLELKLTNKMYFIAAGLAAFITTVTLGILPLILNKIF